MAIGSGIGAQFGIVAESTFNTYVAPTRFHEFNSESLTYRKNVVQGSGLRAGGQVARSVRRVVTTFDAGGDVEFDLMTNGLGLMLSYCMGTAPSPSLVTTGVYTQTFTLADLFSRSFTAQVGVPQYGGTVTPKTLTGCKIASWELGVSQAGIATGKFTIDAAGYSTSQSLATASYTAATTPFHFAQAAVTVDAGSVTNIKDFSLTVDNALGTGRYNLGGAGAKLTQNVVDFRKLGVKFNAEFTDTTLSAKHLSDAAAALVLTFTGPVISGTHYSTLTITMPAVKLDEAQPTVGGPAGVDVPFSGTVLDDGSNEPLTIVYKTSDSAL